MNTKLGPSDQESSIFSVSSAGATVSSSTAPFPLHIPQTKCTYKVALGDSPHRSAQLPAAFCDSLEDDESSQSLSDSLNCRVTKRSVKKLQDFNSEFSDSLEDSGEDTDDTAVDSDTGSFYSVDSHLTPHSQESVAQDTEYFSESTLYNSAQSLNTPQLSSHSSFQSFTSNDTTDGFVYGHSNLQKSSLCSEHHSALRSDSSNISLDYTSCPDLSPEGLSLSRRQHLSPTLAPVKNHNSINYRFSDNHLRTRSSPLKSKRTSSSSMSTVEGSASPKLGEEFEIKKKKGLMSSFRKSRKTSRKLRQQKKAAADGDSTSTGTGVTSDGEQDLLVDSEPSAPNSPAPTKNDIGSNAVEDTIEKPPEETILNSKEASHERLNGTAILKETPQPNSMESSPAITKSNKITEATKKSEEKEEKKARNFGGSIFRKKKTEQVTTPSPAADLSADAVVADAPEIQEGEKVDEVKDEPEESCTGDAPSETLPSEDPKPTESKASAFRSYISSVQFVKNWTVSAETPKAQQTCDAVAKPSLSQDAVDGEKMAVNGTDTAPDDSATTTIETKKVTTSSVNSKPSSTEVTSKKTTTVTIVSRQSPKVRNSPTNVLRQGITIPSQSPASASPTKVFFKTTTSPIRSNVSRRSKSPTPVIPKRLSLEVKTSPSMESPSPSWSTRANVSPKSRPPPPLTVTPPSDDSSASLNATKSRPWESNRFPDSDPQPNKMLPVKDSEHPKKIIVNRPQESKATETDPPKPKKVLEVNFPPPKITPSNEPQKPKKLSVNKPQHQKKALSNTVKSTEAAITPSPVPFPVSTPGMGTPPSSPEGHPGRDARETPEGDRVETERNSLLDSTGLTDSWAGSSSDKREHLYKILVIGELGTGKTSIIKRYVHQFFSQHYRATIGVDFALKVLNWDNSTVIRLQLWDIAGQERFGNMTRVYYKEAVGAFVVFDVTRAQTFDAVTKWKTDLDTKVTLADGSPIPAVLLANKCDQPKEGVVNNPARMDDYCRERGFSGWFETSAKENINIDEAARFLVNKILSNEKQGMMMTESMDTDKFSVDGKTNPADKSGCRC